MNRMIGAAVLCCGLIWATRADAAEAPALADVTGMAVATAPAERMILTMAPVAGPAPAAAVVEVAPPVPLPSPHPVLAVGPIADQTHTDSPSGDPLTFLREVYTTSELSAGGPVTVTWSTATGGPPALVPEAPSRYTECLGAPLCVLIDRAQWDTPGWTDNYNAMRVMIAHEWGHVLSFRYQHWMTPAEYFAFVPVHAAVDEECLADTIASIVLARGGFPPNETADYIVHYDCESFWGAEADRIRPQAESLASDILRWANTLPG